MYTAPRHGRAEQSAQGKSDSIQSESYQVGTEGGRDGRGQRLERELLRDWLEQASGEVDGGQDTLFIPVGRWALSGLQKGLK